MTRWRRGHDDPRQSSLFSLFAIRHEDRWGLDAVRNSVSDVDTRIYLGVIALEDENDLRDWFDAFVERMNASIPLNADISGSSYEATRGVAWQSEDKGELP